MRLGRRASQAQWLVENVTEWEPSKRFDIWHDRAAFHFLVEASERAAYVARLTQALKPGGHAIIATFAAGSAFAQDSCEAKAVGKDGKALAGAAKTSYMKKCMHDSCESKAMSADGKKLAGAAKNSFMKKCEAGG